MLAGIFIGAAVGWVAGMWYGAILTGAANTSWLDKHEKIVRWMTRICLVVGPALMAVAVARS